jgi:hypothetical protein
MRIYFAAYETQKSSYKIELPLDSNLFLTYFYHKKVNAELPNLKPKGHTGIITIDSGAHSFFEQMGVSVTGKKEKKGKKAQQDPEVYFAKYLEWVKEWYNYFDYFVELDLQEVVGQKRVTEWREIMAAEGVYDKCITVFHSSNTEREFDELLDTSHSGYIGLEGIRPSQPMLPYNRYLKKAYDAKVKVHGFAFTRADLLYDFPFYSVDSSSWCTVVRYGVFQIFNNGRMLSCAPVKDHFIRSNIPIFMHNSFRKPEEIKVKEEWACTHYKQLEYFFTDLWMYRGIDWEGNLAL